MRARLLCMQGNVTALMFASMNGFLDTVKLLLENGAQVDRQNEVMSGDG